MAFTNTLAASAFNVVAIATLLPMLLVIMVAPDVAMGHGGMVEPPMRSVMWRYDFDSPVNYDWMGLYCGGFDKFSRLGGKCGLCGDPFNGPFHNDKGGMYDNGIIVRHYPMDLRQIDVKIEITAFHRGYFTFKLCPNNARPLTKACLDRYPLTIREGREQGNPLQYHPPDGPRTYELTVELPPGLTCDRCVLQWTYTAGNNHGVGRDGRACVGCGLQETFVNCADISIGGTVDKIPVDKSASEDGSLGSGRDSGSEVVLPDIPVPMDQTGRQQVAQLVTSLTLRDPDPRLPQSLRPSWSDPPRPPPREITPARQPVQPRLPPRLELQRFPQPQDPRRRPEFPPSPPPLPRQPSRPLPAPQLSARHPWDNMAQQGGPVIDTGRSMFGDSAPTSGHSLLSHVHHQVKQAMMARGAFPDPHRFAIGPGRDPSISPWQGDLNQISPGSRGPDDVVDPRARGHFTQPPWGGAHPADRFTNPSAVVHHNALGGGSRGLDRSNGASLIESGAQQGDQSTHAMAQLSLGRHLPPIHHFSEQIPHRTPLQPDRHSHLSSMTSPIDTQPHSLGMRGSRPPIKLAPPMSPHDLPSRIVVHSIPMALYLLSRHPELRGRVYLSQRAHMRSKYSNIAHRYRKRIQHQHQANVGF